jgi:hypothetical protein
LEAGGASRLTHRPLVIREGLASRNITPGIGARPWPGADMVLNADSVVAKPESE